ncbi:hypothetical protein [Rhodococcus sp. BH5]|uniref:hypothetical protein n=1 Tax=Rhodococcus sp. BH5 TaxID=2871702 RepID=UPI0022CD25DD|nr:hypothetical protein [Rhodococcus sp. BH5]MCZ9635316.1 hypothetical protein [Rhodococcus sp. BH5]
MLEDNANDLDHDHLVSSDWAVDALCPECSRSVACAADEAPVQGLIDLDANLDLDLTGFHDGDYAA